MEEANHLVKQDLTFTSVQSLLLVLSIDTLHVKDPTSLKAWVSKCLEIMVDKHSIIIFKCNYIGCSDSGEPGRIYNGIQILIVRIKVRPTECRHWRKSWEETTAISLQEGKKRRKVIWFTFHMLNKDRTWRHETNYFPMAATLIHGWELSITNWIFDYQQSLLYTWSALSKSHPFRPPYLGMKHWRSKTQYLNYPIHQMERIPNMHIHCKQMGMGTLCAQVDAIIVFHHQKVELVNFFVCVWHIVEQDAGSNF